MNRQSMLHVYAWLLTRAVRAIGANDKVLWHFLETEMYHIWKSVQPTTEADEDYVNFAAYQLKMDLKR